jgi:outer membrane protein OmpU
MKNIIKTLIVMLTSVSLFASAHAGSLGVSGTAKATYNIQSGKTSAGKGLGITNELNFTASGELDNGYTWSYSMELDPGATTAAGTTDNSPQNAQNDDTKLTMTTPYGTVGVFISEGGLDKEDGASQSVYSRPTDSGDPSSGAGDNYTIDSYNNVQFHTPADLLPFSTSFKIAYAPDLHAYGSGNNASGQIDKSATGMGRSATEYQVTAAPIDGLAIGASYIEFSGSGLAKMAQKPESGSAFATYAYGPFGFGLSKALKAPINADSAQTSTTQVDYYDQTNYSVSYAVNDDLSISYEMEEDKRVYAHTSINNVKQESSAIQAAYTMGGMTLAISRGSYDNAGYVADFDNEQTLFAVTMAF